MCTAITLTTKDGYHLFGRNMDLQYNFNQEVTLVPRNFNYINRATKKEEKTKYAMIGMASIIDNHPCFAEASNEKGLSCAGLNFPKYAHWNDEVIEGKNNLPPYDIILWSLANFGSVKEIREEIEKINIVGSQVNDKVPLPTLHWILADKEGDCIVVENTIEGLKISENNLGVLTNSPPFNWHVTNLSQYIKVTPIQASENYWGDVKINPVGEGEGAKSLPGDFSSPSRFVKIAYLRNNSPKGDDLLSGINQFFHVLSGVAMIKGAVITPEDMYDITQYTSCMCQETGVYYYNTYNNTQINAIDMNKEDLDGKEIKVFGYRDKQVINYEN